MKHAIGAFLVVLFGLVAMKEDNKSMSLLVFSLLAAAGAFIFFV